jgi:hypothetical protein
MGIIVVVFDLSTFAVVQQLAQLFLDSWREACRAWHGFLAEQLPYNRQDRSQGLGGSSPVQEDGNREKGEMPVERTIIPGQEAI